jgi:hypothetical protein
MITGDVFLSFSKSPEPVITAHFGHPIAFSELSLQRSRLRTAVVPLRGALEVGRG